ncbi:MAG: haloacid dehalogenase-like hydrolase [Anaerolineae bacterium]|nr:haloacid dehalogenase-like hydrolase [Thermoflexus sp.]MDW8065188.1 haloacid dehalogenase-like hydrolase [Anaerolineae bacterium]
MWDGVARWVSFTHVFLDCDGTLVRVEGIVELARMRGQETMVEALTEAAMAGRLPLEAIYEQRLALIQPTRTEIRRLIQIYRENLIPDAPLIIQALQACGIAVHVLSGGLEEAVRGLGLLLGIPPHRVHAVRVHYDPFSGAWWRGEEGPVSRVEPSPLLYHDGKARFLESFRAPGRRLMLVGDGATDLAARPAVHLFVGFGGVFYRPAIAEGADVYIVYDRLAPLLPLILSPERARRLQGTPAEAALLEGLRAFRDGQARFRDAERQRRFLQAWESSL